MIYIRTMNRERITEQRASRKKKGFMSQSNRDERLKIMLFYIWFLSDILELNGDYTSELNLRLQMTRTPKIFL